MINFKISRVPAFLWRRLFPRCGECSSFMWFHKDRGVCLRWPYHYVSKCIEAEDAVRYFKTELAVKHFIECYEKIMFSEKHRPCERFSRDKQRELALLGYDFKKSKAWRNIGA